MSPRLLRSVSVRAVDLRVALVMAVLAALSVAPGDLSAASWLVGRWHMTQDSEGDEKDWLEFTPDGTATSIAPNGRRTPGEYVVADGEVRITFTIGGRSIPITLTHSPDKQKLFARSKRTSGMSVYEKVR